MKSAIYDKSGPDNYKVQPLSALTPWYAFLSAAKCKNHALILQRAELFVMGEFLSLKFHTRCGDLFVAEK